MLTSRALLIASGLAGAGALAVVAPQLVAAQASHPPRSATIQKVYPSAVRIEITAGGEVVRSASGIAFARDHRRTYVVTNAHVVEPGRAWKEPVEVRVLASDRQPARPARVLVRGRVPDCDLAVIELEGTDVPVTPLAPDDTLELGTDLVVIGAPFGRGLSVAAGIVSQVEYEFAEAAGPRTPKALKTDAAIGYGSSGGGVFDVPGGRLVGVVEGYRTARVAFGVKDEQYAFDVPMPGETFVAPAAKIRRFLAERGLAALAPGPTGAPASAASASAAVPSRAAGGARDAGAPSRM